MIRRCHVHEPSQLFIVFLLCSAGELQRNVWRKVAKLSHECRAIEDYLKGEEHLSWAANHDHVFRIERLLHGIERQCVGGVFLVGDDVVDLGEARHESRRYPQFARRRVVVDHDADIDAGGDLFEVPAQFFAAANMIIRRNNHDPVCAGCFRVFAHFDRVSGSGTGGSDYNGKAAIHFFDDNFSCSSAFVIIHCVEFASASVYKKNTFTLHIFNGVADVLSQRLFIKRFIFIEGRHGEVHRTPYPFFQFLRIHWHMLIFLLIFCRVAAA